MANIDRCNERCNSLDNLSGGTCVPNKTENSNLSAFNVITRINK